MLTDSKLAKRSALLKSLCWLDGRKDLKTLLLTRESLSTVKIKGDITGNVPNDGMNASEQQSTTHTANTASSANIPHVRLSQVTLRHAAWKESEDGEDVSLTMDIHVAEAKIDASHLPSLFPTPSENKFESRVALNLIVDHLRIDATTTGTLHGALETIYKSCGALVSFRKSKSQGPLHSWISYRNPVSLHILKVSFSNHIARAHNISSSTSLDAGQTVHIESFASNEFPVIDANDIRLFLKDQLTLQASIHNLNRYDLGGWKLAEPVSYVFFEWTSSMMVVRLEEATLVESSTNSADLQHTPESSLQYHFALIANFITRPFHFKCQKLHFQVPSIESTMTWENVGLIVQKQEPAMGDGTLAQLSVGSLRVADILHFPRGFRIAGLWAFPTEWSLVQIVCPEAVVFMDKAKAKLFWDQLVQEMTSTSQNNTAWWHQLQTPNAAVSEVSVKYQLDASKSQKLSSQNMTRKLIASAEILEAFAADETSLAGLVGRYASHMKKTTETRRQDMYRLHESATDSAAAFLGRVAIGARHPLVAVTASLAGLGVKDALALTIEKGKEQRGADRSDSYRFGDVSRGLSVSAQSKISRLTASGKASRGGDPDDAYVFGDFSRGVAASFRDRRSSSNVIEEGAGASDSGAVMEGSSSRAGCQDAELDVRRDGIDDGTGKSSERERYAGIAGSVMGSMAGMAVLGPLGMLAGSFAGDYVARVAAEDITKAKEEEEEWDCHQCGDNDSFGGAELFERISANPSTTHDMDPNSSPENCDASENPGEAPAASKAYRFGDITRGIIAKGKVANGRRKDSNYRFGDFSRGLMSSWK